MVIAQCQQSLFQVQIKQINNNNILCSNLPLPYILHNIASGLQNSNLRFSNKKSFNPILTFSSFFLWIHINHKSCKEKKSVQSIYMVLNKFFDNFLLIFSLLSHSCWLHRYYRMLHIFYISKILFALTEVIPAELFITQTRNLDLKN